MADPTRGSKEEFDRPFLIHDDPPAKQHGGRIVAAWA
jgi:hypothetical protein